MHQMILTLIAIAMTGAMLVASIRYVNPAAQLAQEEAARLEEGFRGLKAGYEAYVAANGSKPSLLSQITPAYAFTPPAPQGMSWSFGSGGFANEGRWFCLSGDAGPASYRAILKLTGRFSPQAYFVNSSCGATAHAPPAEDGNGWTPLAATLWVASYAQQTTQSGEGESPGQEGGEPPGQDAGGPPGLGGGGPPGRGGGRGGRSSQLGVAASAIPS